MTFLNSSATQIILRDLVNSDSVIYYRLLGRVVSRPSATLPALQSQDSACETVLPLSLSVSRLRPGKGLGGLTTKFQVSSYHFD